MGIWMDIAKALVSLVALITAVGGALVDLVIPVTARQHIYNPHWPPHAKFHNGQTISLGVLLGLLSLGLLWYPGGDQQVQFHVAVIVASLYWLALLGAIIIPGTRWSDPEFEMEEANAAKMPAQIVFLLILSAILILGEIFQFL
jgi:hypothetical protein